MIVEKPGLQSVPRWEKVTWFLIALYLILALAIFWIYGFSRLPFPV